MKKKDLEDLMLRSLTEDLESDERLTLESELIPDYGFSTGFRDKVMKRITGAEVSTLLSADVFSGLDSTFVRIALTGIAAIVILALSIFINQGSLSYDALLGLDSTVDEGLVSLLIT